MKYETVIQSKSLDTELAVTIWYHVYGTYVQETHEDPPEYPVVEIECITIEADVAKLLGISPVLNTDKAEAMLRDSECDLTEVLLENWNQHCPEW